MKLLFQRYSIKEIQAQNFLMHPVELRDFIDFEVRRVYYITQPKGNSGAHCHMEEKEFFVLIQGTCTAIIDQGNGIEEMPLGVNYAIYVGNYVWHGFKDFSSDAVLLALSSTNYRSDRSDYMEDYAAYQEIIKKT